MPYVTKADLADSISTRDLVAALDDNADGREDTGVWDAVAAGASQAVDDLLAARYVVPFSTPPPTVKHAAKIFALEMLFQKRGLHGEEKNPWTDQANALRSRLAKIGAGDLQLDLASAPAKPSAAVITEQSRTQSGYLST